MSKNNKKLPNNMVNLKKVANIEDFENRYFENIFGKNLIPDGRIYGL